MTITRSGMVFLLVQYHYRDQKLSDLVALQISDFWIRYGQPVLEFGERASGHAHSTYLPPTSDNSTPVSPLENYPCPTTVPPQHECAHVILAVLAFHG